MNLNKSLITYVFGFGRSNLISSNKTFADEFFYGYLNFAKEFEEINYIEFENNINKNIFNKFLLFISKVLRKISKLSFFLENICTYQNFRQLSKTKHIILTNDRIGLSLMPFLIIYKLFKLNTSTVIVMGLLAKDTNNIFSHAIQRLLLNIFFKVVDNFIFLSKSEYKQAKVSFRKYKNKFQFIPFCIDTKFWKPIDKKDNVKNKIIFIGNDSNRLYDLVLDIASDLSQYEFVLVTSNIQKKDVKSKNVTLIEGSWNRQILTDDQLKNIYSEAVLSIIPLKNSYQPSGQSVALQSMSMGVPVMITNTIGFWDKEVFFNNKNIYFISKNTLKIWVEEINKAINDRGALSSISSYSKSTVNEMYNSDTFYKAIKKVVLK